jgi:predicted nucleic acid-binding protein
MRVFLDSDVVLDFLARREPHFAAAARLFLKMQEGDVQAFTSSIVFVNVHYLLRKALGKVEAIRLLKKLRVLIAVLPTGERAIDLALASEFKDLEDAVQYYTALDHELDVLVTRNSGDYRTATMTVLSPAELLAYLET